MSEKGVPLRRRSGVPFERRLTSLAATQLELSDEALEKLDAASAFDSGHPYNMLHWDMPMALGYGGMFDQIEIDRFPGRR